jgi:hypothetical protein
MSHVSSLVKIILRITRDVRSTRTYERKHTQPLHSMIYSPPAQVKQTLYTQPIVTYAQVTKQKSSAPTNTDQEPHINQPHQQTRDMQEF